MKAYMIYTYGGAEVLEGVFNGVASLVRGGQTLAGSEARGTLFTVFIRLGFSVGLVWVVVSAYKVHVVEKTQTNTSIDTEAHVHVF